MEISNGDNKFMYCYHCNESSNDSIKTISTDNVSETPVTLFNKKGNGYARIILYEENNSNN